MKIIYPLPDGGIAVIHPTGALPIADVAQKDVPTGVPYRIVPSSTLPADRSLRDAWVADFSAPDGHGLGHAAWAALQEPAQ